MAEARKDGAPAGTNYACYVCGYDTRWNPWSKKKDNFGRPANDGVGVYTEGIGVKHESTEQCSKIMNHFMDQRYDLTLHHQGAEVE